MTTTRASDDASIPSTPPSVETKDRIIYFAATGIVAGIMLWSAYNFALVERMKEGFTHLGLPNWFRLELTVAKVLGVLALLIPRTPNRIREFAYFGFGLTIVSATIAHRAVGDPLVFEIPHALIFTCLVISYGYHHKRTDGRLPRITP